MIEAKKRKPAKPPEDRSEANSGSKSQNWRTKATKATTVDESSSDESEEEVLPIITKTRKLKVAAVVADDDESGDAVIHLPYKDVTPVVHNSKRDNQDQDLISANREEKSYRVRAPVQKDGLGKQLSNKLMNTEITISLKDLLGASPEVRESTKAKLTKSRRPIPISNAANEEIEVLNDTLIQEDIMPFYEEQYMLEYDAIPIEELPPTSSAFIVTSENSEYPIGSVIIPDPYMQYLASVDPADEPKQVYMDPQKIYVARDSAPLRVIFPIINEAGIVEAVMDSGSQIVSMSYDQAITSRLQWDPDIQIYMQSANKSIEKSVGLARNIPFKFGNILVYLQVHIIRGAAYKVLLGRPFEMLTESTVQNSSDGSQTLTLKDPNTGRRCTMPTRQRERPQGPKGHPKATIESVPDEDDKPQPRKAVETESEPAEATLGQSSKGDKGFRLSSRN
jgi:hypothetical protein